MQSHRLEFAVLPMQSRRMPVHSMAMMSLQSKKRHNCTARAVCSFESTLLCSDMVLACCMQQGTGSYVNVL